MESNITFKNQFNLVKTNDKTGDFYTNKYSYLNSPTTYGVEPVTPENMYPFNEFETLKKNKMSKYTGNRRDNTIIINDYHSNIVGQYARPKKELDYMFEPVVNLNALVGDTRIVDKIGLNRYSDNLKNKNNEYPENTYIRAELIDGVPTTFAIRPREKSLEELRGDGVNSQRLDPNARLNQTGMESEGISLDPKTINITKFKIKSYRDQESIDDLLRTTGVITRPEWRSLVKEPATDRSYFKSMEGPAMASVMREEMRNEQAARPTVKEETIVNTYQSNVVSSVPREEYRNEQAARPTIKEELLDNPILNPKPFTNNAEYRNEQSARPTIRMDYISDVPILNPKPFINNAEYRNEQSANPTIRMDYQSDVPILNPKPFINNPEYRNEQSARPTIRMDYIDEIPVLNPKPIVEKLQYHNEQPTNPTLREVYNPYTMAGSNMAPGIIVENNQSAKPTLRENDMEYMGSAYNNNASLLYENNQSARPTNRILTEENSFSGPGFNQASSTYKKYTDITRSGVVEEVLAKDYKGGEFSFVPRNESRIQSNNMVLNPTIEKSIDLTNRDLMGGGTDRLPQGTQNIGQYTDWNRREKNGIITGRVRNVGVNYIQEIPDTRGYNILQERSPINMYVPDTINNNPFINNILYTGNNPKDIIRENTIINDRNYNRN